MAAIPMEEVLQRLAHLEGWKESQERFTQHLSGQLGEIVHRLERVEDQLKFLDQKWEARLATLEERWETRLTTLEERWDAHFNALEERWDARFNALEERWETRFNASDQRWEGRFKELLTRFWWVVGFQFTTLLAILGLLLKQ
mgnify:CR=1 FL=1